MKKINRRLVNKSYIARELGVTSQYISLLMLGKRKNLAMLAKIQQLIEKELKAA